MRFGSLFAVGPESLQEMRVVVVETALPGTFYSRTCIVVLAHFEYSSVEGKMGRRKRATMAVMSLDPLSPSAGQAPGINGHDQPAVFPVLRPGATEFRNQDAGLRG